MTHGRTWLMLLALGLAATPARADVFDRYGNADLGRALEGDGVQEITRLTPRLVAEHGQLVPNAAAAFLVVRTQSGLHAKLLVQFARQRTSAGIVPIALVERFACYKASDAVQASGANLHLYAGFLFSLGLGQVVPADVGGDVRFGVEEGQGFIEPVGKAKLYLVTKHVPGVETKKQPRPEIGQTFEPRFFTGTYKLHDDGRRLATLRLKVSPEGEVTGEYVSQQSGRTYEVHGKVLNPRHAIQFSVKFPQSEQFFQGWMFTQGGDAIAGSTKMQDREFGFYALRTEDE